MPRLLELFCGASWRKGQGGGLRSGLIGHRVTSGADAWSGPARSARTEYSERALDELRRARAWRPQDHCAFDPLPGRRAWFSSAHRAAQRFHLVTVMQLRPSRRSCARTRWAAPPPVLGSTSAAAAASCSWGASCGTTGASAARCGALWTSCFYTTLSIGY